MDISSSRAAKNFGSVSAIAHTEPVHISYQGEPGFVLVTAEHFDAGKAQILESYEAAADHWADHLAGISAGLDLRPPPSELP